MNRTGERIARTIGVLALALSLWLAVSGRMWPTARASNGAVDVLRIDERNADAAVVVARAVGAFLVQRAATGDSQTWPTLSVPFAVIPSDGVRAALGAAVSAGIPIHWWDSSGVRALALTASHAPRPQASTLIAAHALVTDDSATFAMTVSDVGGVLDSVTGGVLALRLAATQLQSPVRVLVRRDGKPVVSASVRVPGPVAVRRVLFYGAPGWETKFVMAALEESGWLVDGTLTLSPTARVRIGAPALLDTARYSAVVVLDSGHASARDLRRFVGQGGGVLFAGEALRDPAFATLLASRITTVRAAVAGGLLTDQPRRGLSAYHLRTDGGSIVLERDGRDAVVTIARRLVGRVLASGYRSTWHWRMEGREGSADEHRRWWNELVSAVAFAPADNRSDGASTTNVADWPGDAAPLADLVARLGARSPRVPPLAQPASGTVLPLWLLFAITCAALVTEWGLRRQRGAP